jgi:hypothetical protein
MMNHEVSFVSVDETKNKLFFLLNNIRKNTPSVNVIIPLKLDKEIKKFPIIAKAITTKIPSRE